MPKKLKRDNRNRFWATLEESVHKRASNKDKRLKLRGIWKKFVSKQGLFKIYAVDGEYVRTNLSVLFGHGGHGYVHEFIPLNEIWISTHHFDTCGCRKKSIFQKISKKYFDSTVIHEITEFRAMKKGKSYWVAHQGALKKEREIGLLKNPFSDISNN